MHLSPLLLQNEEILKKVTSDYQEKLKKAEEKYRLLKKHAEEKIERFVLILLAEKRHTFKLESLRKRTMTAKFVVILELTGIIYPGIEIFFLQCSQVIKLLCFGK